MHLRKALIFYALLPVLLQAQPVLKNQTPQWVESISPNFTIKSDTSHAGGFYYLLLDRQYNYTRQENFQHFAYKILTNEGVQQMSDLSVDFNPAYQSLSFHSIKIFRKNEVIDNLKSTEIKTIQREESMDRFLYDGYKTAIINIKDVRVGDIVEYSYSTKGYNPVYKEHFSQFLYFENYFPAQKFFQRVVLPKNRDFQIHYRNGEINPVVKENNQQINYSWSTENVAAVVTDNNVPNWFDPYKYVVVTDFKNWKEVNDWALEQFVVSSNQINQLKKKLPKNLLEGSTEEKISKAIRFVQDEIRYLGFENGIHSHKPHPPHQVLEQRYGDCKDKSLLLASIVSLYGIEAHPVLVNTNMRDKITEDPPTTNSFDHCVVQLKYNNQSLFIDPTINNQGGSLENIFFPTYSKGLIVSPSTTDLVELNGPISTETIENQFFELGTPGAGATFKVQTTYSGRDADNQRSEFADANLASTQKSYLSYYGNLYPDVISDKMIELSDDRLKNIFVVKENYSIKKFWKDDEAVENQIYCEFYPQSIERLININKLTNRKAPYKLSYPLSYKQIIKIKLPESWNIPIDNKSINSDYYSFDYSVSYQNDEVELLFHYQTKADEVPVEFISQFVKDHQQMMNVLTYNLTYAKPNESAAEESRSMVGAFQFGIVMLSIAIGVLLILKLNKFDPPGFFESMHAQELGGWLILISIGLSLTPILSIVQLVKEENNYFNTQAWAALWDTGQLGLLAFISLELGYNIIYVFFNGLLLLLFFQRRTSLPLLIQIFYATTFIMILVDSTAASCFANTSITESFKDIFKSLVVACIWIPYFRTSERVKRTFLNRL